MSDLRLGLLGYPLIHTLSPSIHEKLFSLSGRRGQYTLFESEQATADGGWWFLDGFNVTIPHKQAVMPFLNRLDESALLYGAVNTVCCGTERVGYNTDCLGLERALLTAGLNAKGHVLVCGCGGAGQMAAVWCLKAGCRVTVAVRPRGLEAAFLWAEALRGTDIAVLTYDELKGPYDLLINATPAGMFPHTDAMPVSDGILSRVGQVFDTVYNPADTLLLQKARQLSLPAAGGLLMLVWQAAAAHRIWYGAEFSEEDIAAVAQAGRSALGAARPADIAGGMRE